jgi:GT2 family glycosyltransferase
VNDKVSVIVCTSDRCHSLKNTLEVLEKNNYKNIEVVIVDASSTEDTMKLIQEVSINFLYPLKYEIVSQKNVAISRNVGIKLSSSPIIVFLDDDVIPPPEWIDELLATYNFYGEKCGGVGGTVRDMTKPGYPLQYRKGITNLMSNTIAIRPENASGYNQAEGFWFSGFMGANSSYRREVLELVGGHDEFYEYFLEETDLCLQIIKAGYEIHFSNTIVDHYPAASHNRKDQKHLTCWYSLAKNTTYFALKHAYKKIPFPILLIWLTGILIYRCFLRILRLRLTHKLSLSIVWKYINEAMRGVAVGWRGGMALYTRNKCTSDSCGGDIESILLPFSRYLPR